MAVALVALGERRFREHGGPRLLISWDDARPFSTFMFYNKTKKKQLVVPAERLLYAEGQCTVGTEFPYSARILFSSQNGQHKPEH